jgi:hypothetical protein
LLPIPTLAVDVWLTVLVQIVAALAMSSVLAFNGVRRLKYPGYALGTVMLLNSTQHLVTSWFGHQLTPGPRSAPLLLVASAWILLERGGPKSASVELRVTRP